MPDYAGGPINPGAAMMYVTRPLPLPKEGKHKPIFNFYQGGQSGQGGEAEILDFMGLVFKDIDPGAAVMMKVRGRVTGPHELDPVDICADVNLAGTPPGSIISITGILANAATVIHGGVAVAQTQPIHLGFIANAQLEIARAGDGDGTGGNGMLTAPLSGHGEDEDRDEDDEFGTIQWYIVARVAYGCVVVPAVK